MNTKLYYTISKLFLLILNICFSVDNKSGKELRQYLAHLSEQAATGDNSVLPCVVVLDNLHKAGPLADALGSLPRNLPCLLGTMAQSACSATSLQLQHGFRWVLVAPHMEPARGLLGRVLRRRLATLELEQGPQPELAAILGWLPRVWQHLNAFLETHSSGDVAIGPRLFLSEYIFYFSRIKGLKQIKIYKISVCEIYLFSASFVIFPKSLQTSSKKYNFEI